MCVYLFVSCCWLLVCTAVFCSLFCLPTIVTVASENVSHYSCWRRHISPKRQRPSLKLLHTSSIFSTGFCSTSPGCCLRQLSPYRHFPSKQLLQTSSNFSRGLSVLRLRLRFFLDLDVDVEGTLSPFSSKRSSFSPCLNLQRAPNLHSPSFLKGEKEGTVKKIEKITMVSYEFEQRVRDDIML